MTLVEEPLQERHRDGRVPVLRFLLFGGGNAFYAAHAERLQFDMPLRSAALQVSAVPRNHATASAARLAALHRTTS